MKQGDITRQKEMYHLVTKWEGSGQNQKTFCNSEGINYYKFKYWKTRRNKEFQSKTKTKPKPLVQSRGFVPIEISDTPSDFSGFELQFPNGVTITCRPGMQFDQLKRLIKIF